MKYGDTLQQRSIPAWRAHNIDYDDIKRFIKKRTTAGKGESISVPGRGDEKLVEFDAELAGIFTEQHERINLFIKSKSGEIKRRLDHAKKQLRQLSSRKTVAADQRIPIARLERYSRLESDVVKIGDEVRSLARFTSTNRTAFRKLLKKARKWTRSDRLCSGFQTNVLDGGQSFLKMDFAPLLDDYSETLASIRSLYESRIKHTPARSEESPDPATGTSIPQRLQAATKNGSKIDFDTAIATLPLGESGNIANYFVHPECADELRVSILNHAQAYATKSRQNSLAKTTSNGSLTGTLGDSASKEQDYSMLVADNLDRLAKIEGAVTVDEREHVPGTVPQQAKYFMRWTNDEDAVLASRSGKAKIRTASLKRKHAETFFDTTSSQRRGSEVTFADQGLTAIREDLSKDTSVRPLYKIGSARYRFTGVGDGPNSATLATLDTDITISDCNATATPKPFPFAVLQVRSEGDGNRGLITALDESHLVERVRGFSLQYHALWQTCKPASMSPPFWIPILDRDIRKLPPPAQKRNDSLVPRASSSGSPTVNQNSTGSNSVRGLTDETTAVETPRPSSGATAPVDQLQTPPLKAFRKKRRRRYPEHSHLSPTQREQGRYWSEYDNPEDGSDGGDAYVIYIDPNERSALDKLFDSLGSFFSPRAPREPDADVSGARSPKEDESSDDEDGEEDEASALLHSRRQRGYSTLPLPASTTTPYADARAHSNPWLPGLPQTTLLNLLASLAILALAFILAATSKHKYVRAVDAAVVCAGVASLVFAGVGFVGLLSARNRSGGRGRRGGDGVGGWTGVGVASCVLLVDAVGVGGLLAWVVG